MKFLARLIPLTALMPFVAFAADTTDIGKLSLFDSVIDNFVGFMNNTLVPGIFALAFIVFLWGMFKTFIWGGSDEEKQNDGKKLMLYSIAGFVVMVSLWGIVNLVAEGFGLRGEGIEKIPNLPTTNN